jgi:hypothetical protein
MSRNSIILSKWMFGKPNGNLLKITIVQKSVNYKKNARKRQEEEERKLRKERKQKEKKETVVVLRRSNRLISKVAAAD